MQFTRPQLIIIGVAGFVVIFFALVFLGVIPGLREDFGNPNVELNVWGAGDETKDWQTTITRFESLYPTIRIKYTKIDKENYEKQLLNALAADTGPDVFMFHNTWLPKHGDKVIPATVEKFPLTNFRNLFPVVAEQEFITNGRVFASPVFIDTLALFYNRDIFDNKRIAVAPATWDELRGTVLKLRTLNSKGALSQAALSMGGTSESVPAATDILSLLFLQFKTEMASPDRTRAALANPQGVQAINFYTQFAKPTSVYYTWSDSFKPSIDSFTSKQVAMIFGYASDIPEIKTKNPALNFVAASAPQFNTNEEINFANYWGLAVSAKTSSPEAAWDFVIFSTTDLESSRSYTNTTGRPPALRSLINEYLNNPAIGVFAGQALTARSWPQIDNVEVKRLFDNMIESVLTGRLLPENALREAEEALTSLMRPR